KGVALGLDEEIEDVEQDFFDLLPTISSIWIKNPECKIYMTEKTVKLFQKNAVILRGEYDTMSEKLAREYNLRFLHLDVELASIGDYFEHGVDIITLRFRPDGSPFIHQDCRCQGISAGNTGGGEVSFDLPKDFYLSMTAEDIADKCWHTKLINEKGILASFLKKAKEKKGYFLDFSKK
ncbi:MAG: hypothetical protein J6Z11_07055, partial [Candidatus Riflebacteria bacterium]|nr:hypothetical protein [Candidatus Riflebacteria bacterium]